MFAPMVNGNICCRRSTPAPARGTIKDVVMELPSCKKCENGLLVPLSDYGTEGASVMYKAWVCINPDCGFSIRVDKGQVTFGRKIESPR